MGFKDNMARESSHFYSYVFRCFAAGRSRGDSFLSVLLCVLMFTELYSLGSVYYDFLQFLFATFYPRAIHSADVLEK